jgi:hypothetical protein
MRRRRTSALLAILGALLVVVLGASAAAAQAPVKETITIFDTFESSLLSEACGVEVTITITGSVTVFIFPDQPVGPQELDTANIAVVATADDNQATVREVGISQVRVEPDGTATLSIVGQDAFLFTGILKINLTTGEVILESPHVADITRICELLTA